MSQDPLILAADERIGRVLSGKWRLDRLLGVGGMAAVYEATHKNGKRVAIKMLHATFSSVAEAKERFLQEAYAANAVRHGGVVSVLDDGESEEGELFLLMDLLEGETLEARWTRSGQRLPLDEVLRTAEAILEVLGAAHEAGIVHRDIKPENVFVTESGAIKVLDFGIAYVGAASPSPRPPGDRRTETGSTMGTPAFMAPEQARGRWEEVDARSDVWAVGAVIFSLLSGRCVHEGETPNETLLSAMTKHAPPLADLCPDVPPDVAWVVDRALAFERAARWPDASSMLDALRDAALPTGSSLAPAVTDAIRAGRGGRSPWMLGAAACALAVTAFAAVTVLVPHRSVPAVPVGVVVSAAAPRSSAAVDDLLPPPDPLAVPGPSAPAGTAAVLTAATLPPAAAHPHPATSGKRPPASPSPMTDPLAARR